MRLVQPCDIPERGGILKNPILNLTQPSSPAHYQTLVVMPFRQGEASSSQDNSLFDDVLVTF
jgi:hypothetical protein